VGLARVAAKIGFTKSVPKKGAKIKKFDKLDIILNFVK
jgi:hypothetical protein